jgi:hypothetical protein
MRNTSRLSLQIRTKGTQVTWRRKYKMFLSPVTSNILHGMRKTVKYLYQFRLCISSRSEKKMRWLCKHTQTYCRTRCRTVSRTVNGFELPHNLFTSRYWNLYLVLYQALGCYGGEDFDVGLVGTYLLLGGMCCIHIQGSQSFWETYCLHIKP